MHYSCFDTLSASQEIRQLVSQKKITIEELSGGGCDIRNLIKTEDPHLKNLIVDSSVEDPATIYLSNGRTYSLDLENALGIRYSRNNDTNGFERLAELIGEVYANRVKIVEKKGVFGKKTFIQLPSGIYRVRDSGISH
mgnify:CR=1 FL=1